MSSNKVPAGESSVASGAYPARGSRSEDRDVLPQSPGSAGTTSPGNVLEDKMGQLVSEFMQLNSTMGTVKGVESHFECIERAIQDQNKRLEGLKTKLEGLYTKLELQDNRINGLESKLKGHDGRLEYPDTGVEGQDSRPDEHMDRLELHHTKLENKVRELKSQISSSEEREEVMAKLMEFAFKQEELSVEEAVDLLPSAKRLGMNSLVGKLVVALTNALAVDNCIAIFQLASLCQLDELVEASVDKICKNFIQVSKTCVSFLNLSVEELSRIVFSDQINATEQEVFEGIVLWVRADLPGRQSFFSELLPAIRVSKCSLRFLKELLDHFLVQDQDVFRTYVKKRIQDLKAGRPSGDHFPTQELPCAGARELLFVMGGYRGINAVETLDPTVGSWVSHKIPDAPSRWTWIDCVGRMVLVLEGENQRFRSLDVTTKVWTQLPYLPKHRIGFTVTLSGDQVYVLGGEEPYGTRCDRYGARTRSWDETAHMREGRSFAASVCHAGKLYCSAGLSVPGDCLLSSLEVLDPRGIGKWAPLPPMGVRRSGHCLGFCGRFLWAIGGHDGNTFLSHVERFDLEGQQWSCVRPLDTPRGGLCASVVSGRLHIIGGMTSASLFDPTVQSYDEEEGRWVSAASLQKGRSGHGSCVVRCLPEADEYAGSVK